MVLGNKNDDGSEHPQHGGRHTQHGEHGHEARHTGAAPVTGGREDPAKFGMERRGGDGDWAAEATIGNNLDPVYELIDGRCSYDGLPEGNCAHFPGPQDAVFPGEPGGEGYDGPLTREDGSTAVSGTQPYEGRDDKVAIQERQAREDEQRKSQGGDGESRTVQPSQPGHSQHEHAGEHTQHGRTQHTQGQPQNAGPDYPAHGQAEHAAHAPEHTARENKSKRDSDKHDTAKKDNPGR